MTTAQEEKSSKAKGIVKKYSIGSIVAGIIPVPLVDVAIIAGVQLKMLHSLAKLYETPFSKQLGKSAIAALIGGGGSGSLAVVSKPLLKSVPIVGHAAGFLTMSMFGAASTYALGKVFIQHFETGGTLLTFDAEKMRAYYNEQFSEGRSLTKSYAGVQP